MNHKLLSRNFLCAAGVVLICGLSGSAPTFAADAATRPKLPIAESEADSPERMNPYTELIEHTDSKIELLPIPGGLFAMGSPAIEAGRRDDEGPVHEVKIEPFWMSQFEITWDVYEVWMFDLDIQRRNLAKIKPNERDDVALDYQISQPTQPYTDMTFGMGKKGFPAICMTHFAARTFCQWLSAKTGRYYRLPTEAEWEYACRAGTRTAYHFGDDPTQLAEHAWYFDNSTEKYHKVGLKKPNPWGLHDMHGNVAEWVMDQYVPDFYKQFQGKIAESPLAVPTTLFPQIVRGGSWDDDADNLRCAGRVASTPEWQKQDPQIPKSIWYHTDALNVGFRIIRPLKEPSDNDKAERWDKLIPDADRKSGR